MRRTKEWWARLTPRERWYVHWLERAKYLGRSDYLPDDCMECGFCGSPFPGNSKLCPGCEDLLRELIVKANAGCERGG